MNTINSHPTVKGTIHDPMKPRVLQNGRTCQTMQPGNDILLNNLCLLDFLKINDIQFINNFWAFIQEREGNTLQLIEKFLESEGAYIKIGEISKNSPTVIYTDLGPQKIPLYLAGHIEFLRNEADNICQNDDTPTIEKLYQLSKIMIRSQHVLNATDSTLLRYYCLLSNKLLQEDYADYGTTRIVDQKKGQDTKNPTSKKDVGTQANVLIEHCPTTAEVASQTKTLNVEKAEKATKATEKLVPVKTSKNPENLNTEHQKDLPVICKEQNRNAEPAFLIKSPQTPTEGKLKNTKNVHNASNQKEKASMLNLQHTVEEWYSRLLPGKHLGKLARKSLLPIFLMSILLTFQTNHEANQISTMTWVAYLAVMIIKWNTMSEAQVVSPAVRFAITASIAVIAVYKIMEAGNSDEKSVNINKEKLDASFGFKVS